MASTLTWPDYAILLGSLLALIAIGGAFSGEQRGTADFFLARRRIPWWAACLSFLATEISAVTIISVPATAYSENWEYAQFFVGSSLAKWAVAFLFIPAFYHYDVTTIYQFLAHRFGQASQVAASLFFFVTRLLGSGVRLMVAAFGTDHDLMQRLLTVETRRESQWTLSLTPLGTLATLAIYLSLGAALYTFYAQHP